MNASLSAEVFSMQTKNFTARLLELRSWTVNEMSPPILDVTFAAPGRKDFRVKVRCEDYDQQPATFELLSGNGEFLMSTNAPAGQGVINTGNHPDTGRPFICSPGSRQYHTHPSHLNDPWENYRNKPGYDLGGMLTQIHNAWLKTNDTA